MTESASEQGQRSSKPPDVPHWSNPAMPNIARTTLGYCPLRDQNPSRREAWGILIILDPCPGNQIWYTHPPNPSKTATQKIGYGLNVFSMFFHCLARFQESGRGPLSLAGTCPRPEQVLAILKPTGPLPPSSPENAPQPLNTDCSVRPPLPRRSSRTASRTAGLCDQR